MFDVIGGHFLFRVTGAYTIFAIVFGGVSIVDVFPRPGRTRY